MVLPNCVHPTMTSPVIDGLYCVTLNDPRLYGLLANYNVYCSRLFFGKIKKTQTSIYGQIDHNFISSIETLEVINYSLINMEN